MSACLRSASSALEVLRPMQGHSAAPPATSTSHQLVAQPRKARLSFRKRSPGVEKAVQYDWRFAAPLRVSRVAYYYLERSERATTVGVFHHLNAHERGPRRVSGPPRRKF